MLVCFFFFQAEDGIRDLVRSRGLGDVYKRQAMAEDQIFLKRRGIFRRDLDAGQFAEPGVHAIDPVSYTHLTLPTSDLV